jgi:hypothetical protein
VADSTPVGSYRKGSAPLLDADDEEADEDE